MVCPYLKTTIKNLTRKREVITERYSICHGENCLAYDAKKKICTFVKHDVLEAKINAIGFLSTNDYGE